jgi:hypothetical protein
VKWYFVGSSVNKGAGLFGGEGGVLCAGCCGLSPARKFQLEENGERLNGNETVREHVSFSHARRETFFPGIRNSLRCGARVSRRREIEIPGMYTSHLTESYKPRELEFPFYIAK